MSIYPPAPSLGSIPAMPPPKKRTTPKKTTARRKKSKLTLAGEAAQRGVLLAELKAQGWNLTATAEALDMGHPSAVLRSIKQLGLTEEYEAARVRGDVSPGNRKPSQQV